MTEPMSIEQAMHEAPRLHLRSIRQKSVVTALISHCANLLGTVTRQRKQLTALQAKLKTMTGDNP